MSIPIIIFTGYSGSVKTTLIEGVVRKLTEKGIRVATIKHDVHGLEIDKEGKDSYRFSKAGAVTSVVSSNDLVVFKEHRQLSFDEILKRINDVQIIIVEGYKGENRFDTYGVARRETNKGFTKELNDFVAVITDIDENELRNMGYKNEIFDINDIDGISMFIICKYGLKMNG